MKNEKNYILLEELTKELKFNKRTVQRFCKELEIPKILVEVTIIKEVYNLNPDNADKIRKFAKDNPERRGRPKKDG